MFVHNKTYYKYRILFTFIGVSAGIIFLLVTVSNFYVKDLFIAQVGDQVNDITRFMVNKFDHRYLKPLKLGQPTQSFQKYFQTFAEFDTKNKQKPEIFIFNENYETIIHNDESIRYKSVNPFLSMYGNQIADLKIDEIVTSLPFKTDNGNWYLWSFYKFNNDYFLAYKVQAQKFDNLERLTNFINYFAAGSIVLVCIIALVLAKSITNPISKLVNYSLATGNGDSSKQIPDGLKGELKILGEALDKMHKGLLNNQKEKEKMLAQIAHEIRNPLGGIELLTSLVKEQVPEGDKNIEYLDTVLEEIFRLKSLITSFLNYSKPLTANPEWIEVNDILMDLSSFIKNKTTDRKIDFHYESEIEKIFFDPVHMKQILINLISNSIDSIENEGLISTKLVEDGSKWILKITDTGKGIPEDNYQDLFTPFFTTKKDGTGLGLAICKKLCYENQANILVDKEAEETTVLIIKEKSYE